MSLTFGFFDSVNGDRKYNAQQMSAIFDGIINDGVFDSVGEIFAVSPVSGMNIKVGTGRAWFDHTWTYNDTDYPLTVSAAESALTRIDAIVLEVDNDTAARANTLKIVNGVPALLPERPMLTSTDTCHQHALAYVTVPAGTETITKSMIESTVGTEETPFVTGILETTTVESLWTTWEGEFEEWFDRVKDQLSTDAAGNLQNQIDQCVKLSDKATAAEAKAGTDDSKWMTPAKTAALLDPLHQLHIGDIYHSARNIEEETDGAFIAVDGRTIDSQNEYPALSGMYDLGHRIAAPMTLSTSGRKWYGYGNPYNCCGVCLNGLYFWTGRYFVSETDYLDSSHSYPLYMRDKTGTVTELIEQNVYGSAVCNDHVIAVICNSSDTRVYVYDNSGTLIRNIQLAAYDLELDAIYTNGIRCFVMFHRSASSRIFGYYSDDLFSTFGSTMFGNSSWLTYYGHGISNYGSAWLAQNVQVYDRALYFIVQGSDSYSDHNTTSWQLYRSTDNGESFQKVWTKTYASNDAGTGGRPCGAFFIHNGCIYTATEYITTTGSATTKQVFAVKFALSDGECASQSAALSSRLNYGVFHGFIKNDRFYGAALSDTIIRLDLDTMQFDPWYPIHDYKNAVDFDDATDLVTKDGHFWIAVGKYITDDPKDDTPYGGILVHDILTGKGEYIKDGIRQLQSNCDHYWSCLFEDEDGGIIIPESGTINDDDQVTKCYLNKLDFSRLALPRLDYAYLKTRELDT